MKFIKLILLLFLFTPRLLAQNEESMAEELFASQRYGEAQVIYTELLKSQPNNALYHYRNGVCYLRSRSQKHKAIEHLEKAVELSPHFKTKNYPARYEAPADALNFLGEAYRLNFRFDDAMSAYEKYRERLDPKNDQDKTMLQKTGRCEELCRFGKEVQESSWPVELDIQQLNKQAKLNGTFTSTVSPDKNQMIYSWKVPVNGSLTYDDSKYFSETTVSSRSDSSLKKPLVKETFQKKKLKEQDTIVNITTIGTSVDGQIMLTYYNEKGRAVIYISKLIGNKWSDPVKLPKTVNPSGWEPCEHVSFDGNQLFFVSDRPGGYGGKDIYLCKRLANGEWGRAENAGPTINSKFDDEAPFLHQDGTTLYFSSNRNKPDVTYDIYSVSTDKNGWSKPQIVGYPINSSEQDIFYQVAGDKKRIYTQATSPQPGKVKSKETKKKKQGDKTNTKENNYLITFINPQMSPLTVLKGTVIEKHKKKSVPVQATITVTDNNSGKSQGIYYTERTKGNYSFIIPEGANNNITYKAKGYLFCSENISIKPGTNYFENRKPVYLQPVKKGNSAWLTNIFFEKEQATLLNLSRTELDNIYDFMEENPKASIQIISHLYSDGKYYKPLSEQRAEAVVKYLEDRGISKRRMKAKGYREPLPSVSKDSLNTSDMIQKIEIEITELPKQRKNKA